MASNEKMFTVDKFLGINQEADGRTELAMGEASEMLNFEITDGFNLKTRKSIQRVKLSEDAEPDNILASWAGFISAESEHEFLVVVDFHEGQDRIFWHYKGAGVGSVEQGIQIGALGLTSAEDHYVKIFAFNGKLWIMSRVNTVCYDGTSGAFKEQTPYIPKVIMGAAPTGGGEEFENINLLSEKRRIDYSADGTAKAYQLPEESVSVHKITVDGVEVSVTGAGSWDASTKVYTFTTAPVKGVGNVEFTYSGYAADNEKSRLEIVSMPLVEAFNGATDTRLFYGGKGNICYYTGVTEDGEATPLYVPSMNYVSVDMTGAGVTGLVRHYSRLLVFTRDGTYALSYEPVTLPGGTVTAGFYLRAVNKEFGSDILGQIQTVDNYPRTITDDGVYEWRITDSYNDERYARRVSGRVKNYLDDADIQKIVTCDDSMSKTYYVFLNDDWGTVLINRYGIGKENIWCVYRSELTKGVKQAFLFNGIVHFSTGEEVFSFSGTGSFDAPKVEGDEPVPIECLWKSGFMSFGADFKRKFSSEIYMSVLQEGNVGLDITAESDKRSEYATKGLNYNVFSFESMDFANFTFETMLAPKIKRIRIKVKKFVYYRLALRNQPGKRATVLGYDQKIRYGSMAK